MTEAWRASTCDRCGISVAQGADRCKSCAGSKRIGAREISWLDLAACAGMPLEVFYPASSQRDGGHSYDAAKRVCAGCLVRQQCLDDANATEPRAKDGRHGVRGGMSPNERAAYTSAMAAELGGAA